MNHSKIKNLSVLHSYMSTIKEQMNSEKIINHKQSWLDHRTSFITGTDI